jgi:AraC-like DNA-binding protein
MKLYIRNMACDCCSELIGRILDDLSIKYSRVDLGHADLIEQITSAQKDALNIELRKSGFELLDDKRAILIEKIRNVVDEFILDPGKTMKTTFSKYLKKRLDYDYSYLSALFSEVQAITLEQYIILKRIEQAKFMILFDEFTIAEIAHRLHYSSPAHLSGQFKKVTGLTPSHFRELRKKREDFKNTK